MSNETSNSACILFLEAVEQQAAIKGFIVYSDALLLLKLVLKLREQRNIADDLDTADTFDAELDELVERSTFELPPLKDGPFAYMDSAIEELCKKSEGEK